MSDVNQSLTEKATRQFADLIITNLGLVDELIIGTPAERAREAGPKPTGMLKLYVRVGSEFNEYLPAPLSLIYRLLDRLVQTLDGDEPRRAVHEDLESGMITLHQEGGTQKLARDRPLILRGNWRLHTGDEVPIIAAWWSDNTVRIRRVEHA